MQLEEAGEKLHTWVGPTHSGCSDWPELKAKKEMMIVILKILKKETNETASRSIKLIISKTQLVHELGSWKKPNISVNGSAMMILILK